jgi:phosphohistidine phosphatase
MLSILKGATGRTVQLIAHNPGISFFARSILDTAPLEHLFDRYPTGATTLIDFETESWSEVTWRSGLFVDFAVPRALIQREEEQAAKKAAEAALSPSDTPPDTPTEPLSA